jgi:hypothetical protein
MRLEVVCKPLGVGVLSVVAVGCSELPGSLDQHDIEELGPTDAASEPLERAAPRVWGGEQRLVASDAAEFDQLGYSVSLAGDRALVGAYGESSYRGAAYVFVRSGNSWAEEQKLVANDGAEDESFAWSVSLAGDRALVGAYAENSHRGAAYVFVRSGGSWTEEQKLVASDGVEADNFGWSVSLAGDRALIGAYGKDTARGAVYVFVRNGSSWTEEQQLVASDGALDDKLGYSVSLAGDRALVGAPSNDASRGAALVFVRSGSSWTEEQELVASDGALDDKLGYSVSLAGDRALVGAYWDDSFRGSAYVFARSDSSWTEEQKLVASDGADGHRFGDSVSLAGDRALIGAYANDDARGAAYVFVRSGSSWTEEQRLVASDGAYNDLFGWSVSLSGERALVGAHYDDNLRGAAYVFSPPLPNGDALGAPCTSGEQCASGHCADSVCCDATCDGICEACTAALKGDERDGTCAAVAAGVDAECNGAPEASAPDDDSGCRAGRSPRHAERSWPWVALGLLLSRRRRSAASTRQRS